MVLWYHFDFVSGFESNEGDQSLFPGRGSDEFPGEHQ